MIFERIWAGKGKRRRCKETASIEGGQFFDNCSVKTGEAAANRRQSRPDTIFAFVFNPCIAPRQFRLRGPMGHNGGLTKGWSGPPLINRGLQGKSDSCAGFYREDEWVNREMAYESGVAGDATNRVSSRSNRKGKIKIMESRILSRACWDSARILPLREVSTRRFCPLRNSRIFLNSIGWIESEHERDCLKKIYRNCANIYANVIARKLA